MNYSKIYDDIINNAKNRNLDGYKEKHHIIPKCLGGDDSDENLVYLTAREHFVVHQLLVMIYPDNHKLALAVRFMTGNNKVHIRNNRQFEWIRIRANEANKILMLGKKRPERSKEWCEKLSKAHKGKKHSEETKSKMSKAHKGKPKSDEMKKNMSIVSRNRSDIHRQRLGDAFRGKKRSTETRAKISEVLNKLPEVTCPFCGKTGKPTGMKTWHFDYCKENPNGLQRVVQTKKSS